MCLQELKVSDADFPREDLEALGYHVAVHGQKGWNGVAVLSRAPIEDVVAGMSDGEEDPEARFIELRTSGIRVVSLYVPNGKAVGTEKWAWKLRWMARLERWLNRKARPDEPLLLGGDFNVAPDDRDVARPEQWRDTVLTHEEAREAFRRLIAWGLVDTIRLHHHDAGPFSWWDYRMLAFAKNNGLRIDHLLATAPLAATCRAAGVSRDERKGKLPSDHAPVTAEFDWPGS